MVVAQGGEGSVGDEDVLRFRRVDEELVLCLGNVSFVSEEVSVDEARWVGRALWK